MAERECSGCNQTQAKDQFSKGQWKKGVKARCKSCTAGAEQPQGEKELVAPSADAGSKEEPVPAQADETVVSLGEETGGGADVVDAGAAG